MHASQCAVDCSLVQRVSSFFPLAVLSLDAPMRQASHPVLHRHVRHRLPFPSVALSLDYPALPCPFHSTGISPNNTRTHSKATDRPADPGAQMKENVVK